MNKQYPKDIENIILSYLFYCNKCKKCYKCYKHDIDFYIQQSNILKIDNELIKLKNNVNILKINDNVLSLQNKQLANILNKYIKKIQKQTKKYKYKNKIYNDKIYINIKWDDKYKKEVPAYRTVFKYILFNYNKPFIRNAKIKLKLKINKKSLNIQFFIKELHAIYNYNFNISSFCMNSNFNNYFKIKYYEINNSNNLDSLK